MLAVIIFSDYFPCLCVSASVVVWSQDYDLFFIKNKAFYLSIHRLITQGSTNILIEFFNKYYWRWHLTWNISDHWSTMKIRASSCIASSSNYAKVFTNCRRKALGICHNWVDTKENVLSSITLNGVIILG